MGVRLAKVLALTALLLAVSASSGTAATAARGPILGVVPHSAAVDTLSALTAASASGPLLLATQPCSLSSTPYACWTMRTNTVYAIYWVPGGYSVAANYESLINRYFGDVAAASGSLTNVYSVAMQYYDSAAAIHYQSTFAGSYVDTNPFPASGCDVGVGVVCLTDQQIEDEIQNVLSAKSWHGSTTTMFFVMTPDGVASCFDNLTNECSTNTYCAYHSGFFDTNNEPVVYANEPYAATIKGCSDGTSPNGSKADATINTISHEHNEAITDPAGNAWVSLKGDEIGDICAWNFGPTTGGTVGVDAYNQVINGDHYWLQQEYSNDGNACLQRYTPTSAPTNFTQPVLAGRAGQGQLLSSTEGSWQHAPSGYAYKWQRCAADGTGCADISGATAATYRLSTTDVGHAVRAEVSAHNAAGTSAFTASMPTAAVVPVPTSATAPVLSGVAAVGRKLSTTTGAWTSTVTIAYQWLRCAAGGSGCASIPGATAATYRLMTADAGHTLEARVSATNAAGTAASLSNRSAVVIVSRPNPTKAPHISGHARVGKKLSGSHGSWTNSPNRYRYQWLRCNAHGKSCTRIGRATHSTYRLTKHDAGHRLRLRVTALNHAGGEKATSRATARVPARH
jgi:hypothetical protein